MSRRHSYLSRPHRASCINGTGSHKMSENSKKSVQLYDPDSTLEIRRDMADGYLILLSGGESSAAIIRSRKSHTTDSKKAETTSQEGSATKSSSPTSSELSSLQLAFAALTDGNVLDAIFGAHSSGGVYKSQNTSSKAFATAKAVKKALVQTSEQSKSPKAGQDPFFKIAVETYIKCFEIVITYRIYVEEMSTLTWCWRHQKARQDAEKALEECFTRLKDAMGPTSTSSQ